MRACKGSCDAQSSFDQHYVASVRCCSGRVFLGGSDGHLYELQYNAADSWGRKRCQKVLHVVKMAV